MPELVADPVNHDASPASTVGLATAAARKPRVTWTHGDIANLTTSYHSHGIEGATATFAEKFSSVEVTKKLVELGYLKLDSATIAKIDSFVAGFKDDPLALRHLAAASKKALGAL